MIRIHLKNKQVMKFQTRHAMCAAAAKARQHLRNNVRAHLLPLPFAHSLLHVHQGILHAELTALAGLLPCCCCHHCSATAAVMQANNLGSSASQAISCVENFSIEVFNFQLHVWQHHGPVVSVWCTKGLPESEKEGKQGSRQNAPVVIQNSPVK